jgi:hypothetical protein
VEKCSILTHFSPLLTTFHASRQYKLIGGFALLVAHLNCPTRMMAPEGFRPVVFGTS